MPCSLRRPQLLRDLEAIRDWLHLMEEAAVRYRVSGSVEAARNALSQAIADLARDEHDPMRRRLDRWHS